MISLYSGTPGSGKSLHTAERIYWGLKRGRLIIANFEIRKDYIDKKNPDNLNFYYFDNSDLRPGMLIEIAKKYYDWKSKEEGKAARVKEDEILLVIDECQLLFNARTWNESGRKEWISFFTQHRKYGYEIILCCQFDMMIDKQIRSLIEYEYIHRKVKNFGIMGYFINLFAFGGLFCSVKYWYPIGQKIGSEFFKARKKYYRIYDTFAFFDKNGKGQVKTV